MTFLALVGALLLEQWRPLRTGNQLYVAFARYVNRIAQNFNAGRYRDGVISWLLAVVPVALVTLIVYSVARHVNGTLVFDKDNRFESPAELKETVAQEIGSLPKKEIKKGDTWVQELKMNLPGGQAFTVKRKYTYEGETSKSTVDSTRKVHKITAVDSDIVYSLNSPMAKVSKSNLKVAADSKTTILFDPEVGRAIETNSLLHVTGQFTITSMGEDSEGDLDLTMSNQSEEIK